MKKLFIFALLIAITLFLLGCTSQAPVCGDNVCSIKEIDPNSEYFCPIDCGSEITEILGKSCKYDHECSRSGYCDNGVCRLIDLGKNDICKYSSDCGKGRFCNNGICEVLTFNGNNNLDQEVIVDEEIVNTNPSSGGQSSVVATKCVADLDCGKAYRVGEVFCEDNSSKEKIITPTCEEKECKNVESENIILNCTANQDCKNGNCVEKVIEAEESVCNSKEECLMSEDCIEGACSKIFCAEGYIVQNHSCVCVSDNCISLTENDLNVDTLGEEVTAQNEDYTYLSIGGVIILIVLGIVAWFFLKKKKGNDDSQSIEQEDFSNTFN